MVKNHIELPDDSKYLSSQLISYIGNKRKLLGFIEENIMEIKNTLGQSKISVLDGFAGSGVVSRMLKKHASILHSNDMERYCNVIGNCYLANKSECDQKLIAEKIQFLNEHKLDSDERGIISRLYAPEDDNDIKDGDRVFYTSQNALIIDNMRKLIDDIDDSVKPFVLAPLLYTASVHTNTSGVFKGFYKNSDTGRGQFGGNAKNCLSRITKEIVLPKPIFSDYECDWKMYEQDTNKLVKDLEVDVAYFDPPYNQHPYGSNYFMLNVIADYIEPTEVSKVSGIPVDWNKSDYNKKELARKAFEELIDNTNAKFILISYSTEGIMTVDELNDIFSKFGTVTINAKKHPVFRASRNLSGRTKSLDELLFIIEKA